MRSAALALLLLNACASECERFCGKLELCAIDLGQDRDLCLSTCAAAEEENADLVALCAQCVGDTECGALDQGACAEVCPQEP